MTKVTTKKNILIAQFDGWVNTGKLHPFNSKLGNTYAKQGLIGVKWGERFQYHTSWDGLMPVVHKCLAICHEEMLNEWENSFQNAFMSCSINKMFEECFQFTQWYNKQHK